MTPHLAAPSAPVLLWPGNQPLPASLECVGVLGGTEAISAGQIDLLIPPFAWDAVTRSAAGEAFEIEYRVSHARSDAHGVPIFLDPTMTPNTSMASSTTSTLPPVTPVGTIPDTMPSTTASMHQTADPTLADGQPSSKSAGVQAVTIDVYRQRNLS